MYTTDPKEIRRFFDKIVDKCNADKSLVADLNLDLVRIPVPEICGEHITVRTLDGRKFATAEFPLGMLGEITWHMDQLTQCKWIGCRQLGLSRFPGLCEVAA